jgi:hypothetical protein
MRGDRANYVVVRDDPGGTLFIKDVGPWDQYQSVTNAIEVVVAELYAAGRLVDGRRLLYFDSTGELDEIVHEAGRFVHFAPGPRDGKGVR